MDLNFKCPECKKRIPQHEIIKEYEYKTKSAGKALKFRTFSIWYEALFCPYCYKMMIEYEIPGVDEHGNPRKTIS